MKRRQALLASTLSRDSQTAKRIYHRIQSVAITTGHAFYMKSGSLECLRKRDLYAFEAVLVQEMKERITRVLMKI